MKVVVTSSAQTLADPIDMHFGRAKYFILADTETGRATAHDNAQNLNAAQGAGIQSAETVITGSVGPKAYRALQAAGIKIALVEAICPGTEALRRFKEAGLPVLDKPNSENHWVKFNNTVITHEPGVLPKWLHEQGATVILADGMGSRAQDLFKQNGIQVVVGCQPAAPETLLSAYLSGALVTGMPFDWASSR